MISMSDRWILRELAKRKVEIANDPVNVERRSLWLDLHSGVRTRPMILAEAGGVKDQRKPFEPSQRCGGEMARGVENALLNEIWRFEKLRDDHVVEPFFDHRWRVSVSPDFGVKAVVHKVDDGGAFNARSWDAPIKNISEQFHQLRHREFSVDRDATARDRGILEEAFGDILPIRMRGGFWWTFGLTIQAIDLIGLEPLMLFMYDDPDGLHKLMGFLRDDNLAFAEWLEAEGLLSLNNENDYIGSGSEGYTRLLPGNDYDSAKPPRLINLWLLIESQETVGVGPELYEEFVFPYHRSLAEKFGLVYYGCCEPIHTRWDVVRRMPHLAACSVAPSCNQEVVAGMLKGDYVYSRKPNPTLISTDTFDEELIRKDLRTTLGLASKHSCRLEIIMKDVHTLNNEPDRLARWIRIAREESERLWE